MQEFADLRVFVIEVQRSFAQSCIRHSTITYIKNALRSFSEIPIVAAELPVSPNPAYVIVRLLKKRAPVILGNFLIGLWVLMTHDPKERGPVSSPTTTKC